jgi:hypothetical protein
MILVMNLFGHLSPCIEYSNYCFCCISFFIQMGPDQDIEKFWTGIEGGGGLYINN